MTQVTTASILDRIQRIALIVGVVAVALSVLGAMTNMPQFLRSYLVAFLFWLGITLGAFSLSMLNLLTGGRWGMVIRRVLEAATASIPLFAILFLPIALDVKNLYPWAADDAVSSGAVTHGKERYLNVPFFMYRALGYFAFWIAWGWLINGLSRAYARDPNLTRMRMLQRLSALGLAGYGITITFSSIDWGMTLEPHWFSTMYGVLFMVGNGLAGLAFSVLVSAAMRHSSPVAATVSRDRFHDLGNLLLALVMFWAYISFSQYLIIWSANLPEETPWYVHRQAGVWQLVVVALAVFHFAVPFMLLLMRGSKRNPAMLIGLSSCLVVMRYVDLFWLIRPAPPSFGLHWIDPVIVVAIGAVWTLVVTWSMRRRLDIPVVHAQ